MPVTVTVFGRRYRSGADERGQRDRSLARGAVIPATEYRFDVVAAGVSGDLAYGSAVDGCRDVCQASSAPSSSTARNAGRRYATGLSSMPSLGRKPFWWRRRAAGDSDVLRGSSSTHRYAGRRVGSGGPRCGDSGLRLVIRCGH